MLGTPSRSRRSSPESSTRIETPVHRYSRRLLGLAPESSPLQETSRNRLPSASTMATAAPTQVTLQNPMVPESFHGDAFEDVQDWLDQFERVADYNHKTSSTDKLSSVYFYLKDHARTWYVNRERSFANWDDFRTQLLDTFTSIDRRENAQRLLEIRIQKPNESVAMFSEDMARLFRRADPDMPEERKLRYLLRGVKEQLFAGLVRNPPTTVAEFTKEATAIERALQQRYRQHDMSNSAANTSVLAASNDKPLREIIREVVREELRQLGFVSAPTEPAPALSFVADVVREEVRQAFSSPDCGNAPRRLTYAEAVRRPVNATSTPLTSTIRPSPTLQTESISSPPSTLPTPPITPAPTMPYLRHTHANPWLHGELPPNYQRRKTDLWRTVDRRPVCYHCGEAGHVYRVCHKWNNYRAAQYASFPANYAYSPYDGRRAYNDAPVNIQPQNTMTPRSRSPSPSPARYNSPIRRSFADVARGRSPSPRQGN